MKKVSLVLILLLSVADGYCQMGLGFGMGMRIPLNGGNGPRRSQSLENHVQQMRKDLSLSDDQVIKVRSLLVERDRRRKGTNPMMSQECNQRLQQIFTPEQSKKLRELRQQKHKEKQSNPTPSKDDNKSHPEDWDD